MSRFGLLRPVRWVVLVGICLSVVVTSRGQEAVGARVSGEVIDQQGGTIQNATVILLNSAVVRLQETKTDQSGTFAFRNLSPGAYVVNVERAGFSGVQKSVTLAAGQAEARVSIEMKVAGPGEQVTVSAELGSFRPDESSTATKTNIPLNEIPQGIGVTNQALIQSQQDIRFADAAENISGVNRDVLAAGDIGSALTIRGLSLGVFSNYYRDSFPFDGMVPADTTDVDRVEILKGPASVLYGRAASGGIVTLITKEPLPVARGVVSFQADRYGSVRPTFDITGPIVSSGKLLYRLNGASAAGCATTAEAMGPEAGETRTSTTTPFDNVNDYGPSLTINPITDVTGTAIAGLGAYSATIAVAAAALGTVPATDSLQITVTVTGPGNNSLVLQGYRTRYAPNAI